jgi:hypothetical protein
MPKEKTTRQVRRGRVFPEIQWTPEEIAQSKKESETGPSPLTKTARERGK